MLGPAMKVTTWVLWNAGTVCKPLCQALSSPAQQAADVAQRVLSGTLEALQRGERCRPLRASHSSESQTCRSHLQTLDVTGL